MSASPRPQYAGGVIDDPATARLVDLSVDRYCALPPELAAVLDPSREPTEQEWEQARAEIEYILPRRVVTSGGEGP